MAKSNEVDLVVKARNEASKTLKAIKQAFADFTDSLESANDSTTKGNKALSGLAKTLVELNKRAAGLKALEEVGKNLDVAAKASSRLEDTVRAGAEELGRMSVEAGLAAERSKRLRTQLENEQATLKALNADRKDAARALAENKRALDSAEAAQRRLNETQSQRQRRTAGVGLDIGQAQSSARDSAAAFLAAEVEKAGRAFANAKEFVDLYDDEIRQTRQTVSQLEPVLKAAADQQRKLEGETSKQTATLRQNQGALADSRSELEQLKKVSAEVEALAGKQVASQAKVANAYAKTAAEIERVSRLSAVMGRYSTGSGGFADPKTAAALQKQNAAIGEAEQNWKLLEAEAKRLGVALQSVSGNATEQVNAFKNVVAAARQARAEYNAQVAALGKLQGSAKSSFAAWSQAAGGFRTFSGGAQTVAPAAAQASAAIREAARSTTSLSQSLRTAAGDTRQSLSLFQRLRGEVLALVASYVGLQGAGQQLMGVVNATNTLEAAQSRLNVAFKGNDGRVANELAFIERQADRLGISFSILSEQYSKFAVAAQSANFTGKATRDIFLSVAEAGKVQRLSIDQLQGVFKALEQIISKGKVQSEELRGQLGDRMTGAFQLFADAIGVTTAELDEMLKKGEVIANEETLSKVGERLRQVYGPELANALKSTNTELGRFQNNIYQSQLRVGEGGFVEAFADGLRNINDALSSREGRDFFLALGSALAKVTEGLVAAMPYFDDLAVVLGVIVAFKVGGWFQGFVGGLAQTAAGTLSANRALFTMAGTVAAYQGRWNALVTTLRVGVNAVNTVRGQFSLLGTTIQQTGVRAVAFRAGISALQAAAVVATGTFRAMWLALGGVPGIVLTGLSLILGNWLFSVKETTSAIDEHKRIMADVVSAYEETKNSSGEWAKNVKSATLDQAVASARRLRDSLNETRALVSDVRGADFFSPKGLQLTGKQADYNIAVRMRDLKTAFEAAEISAADFVAQVEKLYTQVQDDGVRQYGEALLDVGRKTREVEKALSEAEIIASELGDTSIKTSGKMEDLADAAKATGDANEAGAKKADQFNAAMEAMGELVPSVAEELKRLKEIDALEKLYQDAAKAATNFGELYAATQRYNQGLSAINMAALGGTGLEASANLIKQFEGFSATPYWDVNANRIGYGSDTVTLDDGSVRRVVEGMRVTEEQATRDLIRRIGEFQGTVKSEIGSDRFAAFSKEQQAVLTSIAYNYGNLTRTGELDAFKNGTVEEIAAAIRRLGSQNNGVNEGRRNSEAALFEQGGRSYQLGQQQFEAETKANEATKQRIADKEFEVQQQQMINDGKAKEAAIEAAVREARTENKNITDEQIAKVRELAALEFDLKNTKTAQKDEQAQANELVKQAQALFQQQMALEAQLKQQQGLGDVTGAEATRMKLQEVNAQFTEAIQKARAMWEAIGGEAATTALAKLDTLITKQSTANSKMNSFGFTSQQVSGYVDAFASGIANAFGSFAQAIVNGENAFKAFGQAVLQTLAQIIQQIAIAILRTMILRALSGMGGPIGAAAGGLLGGVNHGGGVAGSSNRSRKISSGALASPFVYHTGGVAGMKSNEVVSVLERGETIRTEEQESALAEKQAAAERAMNNPGGPQTIRNIITLDEDSAAQFLTSATGEKAIWSILGRNKSKLRTMVG